MSWDCCRPMILVFAERSDDELSRQALDVRPRRSAARRRRRSRIDDGRLFAPTAGPPRSPSVTASGADRGPRARTDRGNEVLAHVARHARPADGRELHRSTPGDPVTLTRVRWGGSLLEEARLHGTPALLTVAPHAVRPTRPPPRRDRALAPRRRERRVSERIAAVDRRRFARRRRGGRLRRPRRRLGGGLRGHRGARRAARRRGRLLARRDQRRLAAAHRPGRADRHEGLARALHRLRDQRRHPAHGRLQGRQEAPRDQPRPRGADPRQRRLRA